jgi:uncharacterized protein YjbJ (UPF0337 family)
MSLIDRDGKRDFVVNEDTVKGKWKEIKGEVRKMWGKVTDDELEQTKGDLTAISGIVQQRYGETKESVQTKLNDYFQSFEKGAARVAEKTKEAVAAASDSAHQKFDKKH